MSRRSTHAVRGGWLNFGLLAAAMCVGAGATTALGQGRPPILWIAAGHSYTVTALDLSPDGHMLASSGEDRTLKLWKYSEGELLRTVVIPYAATSQVVSMTCARFTPDGVHVAASINAYDGIAHAYFGKALLFRVSDGATIRQFDGHAEEVSAVDISPDGQWLATAESDFVKVWRVSDGMLVKTLTEHAGPASHVRFSAAGDRVCGAFDDHSVVLWSTADWSFERAWTAHSSYAIHVVFSPDGSLIGTVSQDGTAKTWTAADGALQHTFIVGSGQYAIAFSPDGATLATGGFDQRIRLWDVASGGLIQPFVATGGYITALCYTADGSVLLSGGGYPSSRIEVWNPNDGSLTRTWTEHAAGVERVVFSPDSTLIGTAARFDQAVRVFDAASGQVRHAWNLGAYADDVAFSPDNQLAAMPGVNRTVVVRRLSDGALVHTLPGHTEEVTGLAFSHDGTLLASGSHFPGSIRLWSTVEWSLVREIPSGQAFGPFASLCFSPDDALLGAAGEGQPLVYRVADGVRLASPGGTCSGVTFSPDGQSFAIAGSVSQSNTRIYRVSDWSLARTIPGGGVGLTFTADGRYLFTADTTALRIWRTSDWTTVRTYDQELGYAGASAYSVLSIAVAPDASRFAYGRFDATLIVAASLVGVVPGHLNCDRVVDNFDINPFVLALSDPSAYAAAYPDCNILNADCNGDGVIDNFDINPLVAFLTGP